MKDSALCPHSCEVGSNWTEAKRLLLRPLPLGEPGSLAKVEPGLATEPAHGMVAFAEVREYVPMCQLFGRDSIDGSA